MRNDILETNISIGSAPDHRMIPYLIAFLFIRNSRAGVSQGIVLSLLLFLHINDVIENMPLRRRRCVVGGRKHYRRASKKIQVALNPVVEVLHESRKVDAHHGDSESIAGEQLTYRAHIADCRSHRVDGRPVQRRWRLRDRTLDCYDGRDVGGGSPRLVVRVKMTAIQQLLRRHPNQPDGEDQRRLEMRFCTDSRSRRSLHRPTFHSDSLFGATWRVLAG